MSGTIIVC
ncbi:Uncharacterised protein g4006 [Pycnogonum litorale]